MIYDEHNIRSANTYILIVSFESKFIIHNSERFNLKWTVSICSKPYIPILLTVSRNISQKNVIKRVKSLISYDI